MRALPALVRALRARRAGTRLLWASAASGDYPVLVGRGLLGDRGVLREALAAGPLASRHSACPTRTSAPLYARAARRSSRELIEIAPGEPHKTLASAELVWRALVAGGMTRADHVVALGGGVVGRSRRLLRRHLPARRAGRAGADHARRAGRLRLRRQDGRRPARRPRTTSAPTTSRPACWSTRTRSPRCRARELAAGWVEVLKTALIAGGELWRRVAADEPLDERTILACARTKLAVVAAGRARRGSPPGAEPRAHRRSRDRDGRPGTSATATARPSGSGCWPRCGCRRRAAARAGARAAARRAGCR